MKFERTPAFDADWKRLSAREKKLFKTCVYESFNPACDKLGDDANAAWPKKLRVKHLQSTRGILEMTWNFSGPDGRATFEVVTVGGERRIRWRRVGGHAIFGKP